MLNMFEMFWFNPWNLQPLRRGDEGNCWHATQVLAKAAVSASVVPLTEAEGLPKEQRDRASVSANKDSTGWNEKNKKKTTCFKGMNIYKLIVVWLMLYVYW